MDTQQSPIHRYLTDLFNRYRELNDGNVADYIPELSRVDPDLFGIALVTVDGHVYLEGDCWDNFTIQSMSKPFTYGLALESHDLDKVQEKIGLEPSGDAFNSISLDPVTGRPLNPMINAGAISATGLIEGASQAERLEKILKYYSDITGRRLEIDEEVYQSESQTGHRNRAIGHMLRNFEILETDPEETLELYFQQCSVIVNCRDLAMMAATLANSGVNPITGVQAISRDHVGKVLSVMASCGMYDYAGSWIYEVGLPAKSGVSGGILAALPGQLGLAVFSPPLDDKGNSVRGIAVCKEVSRDFNLHMLQPSRLSASVIRASYDGRQVRSKHIWRPTVGEVLEREGSRIKVWDLHGELVFGSTEYVLKSINEDLGERDYVILDLKRVSQVDQAAGRLIAELIELMEENNKQLLITQLEGNYGFQLQLKRLLPREVAGRVLAHPNRDQALRHCEQSLLRGLGITIDDDTVIELRDQQLCTNFDESELAALNDLLVEQTFEPGQTILQESSEGQSLYFLEQGQVSVNVLTQSGKRHRVASLSSGMHFGELALMAEQTRSATIIAETPVTCRVLSTSLLSAESVVHQGIRVKLIVNLAQQLSTRLRAANDEIRALG